jgi:hypothetical protein
MPKPKRLYHSGAIVPNDYDFDKNERVLLMVCIPKSPLWVAMYKGLLSMPTNYWFWRLDSTIAHNSVKLAKDVFYNGVYMTCFNELNYNLQEMNFTLKRIENNLSNNKTIATFGQQPAIARNEDGTIDNATNNSVTNSSVSVFEFGSLLETNNISEVLAIALLDDSTIQLPDLNPFNLESKIDTLNSNIVTHNSILNYFSQAFYGSFSSDWNPLFSENFFTRFSKTFNSLNLLGMVTRSFYDSHVTLNQNLSTSLNEDYDTDTYLASNSYFRSLNTWLTTTWKVFEDIMLDVKNCICALGEIIANLELSPTVNVTNNNSNPITVNNSHPITIENIVNGTNTTNNSTTTTTTTTITNPDGSITTTTEIDTEIDYPPIDPSDPNSETTQEYTPNKVTETTAHDAVCGFIFYTMSDLADWVDWLIGFLNPLSPMIAALGINGWALYALKMLETWGTGYVAKLGLWFLRGLASKWLGLVGIAVDFLPDLIREIRDDLSCPDNDDFSNFTLGNFKQSIINKLQLVTGNQLILDFASYIIYYFYDYTLWQPSSTAYVVDMADYAQYCPCPIYGDFVGLWTRYSGNNDEEITIISQSATTISGTRRHGDIQPQFTIRYSNITGTIDVNNPLIANCTIQETHFIDSTGTQYPSTASYAMILTLVNNKTQLKINNDTNYLNRS